MMKVVKELARKKKESGEGGGGAPAWMATFGDLMNLLLCFFVLLFSLSTVSEQKFEDVSISMANSFGVFEGGGSSIDGEGKLIATGISQLNELDMLFDSMGRASQGAIESESTSGASQNSENDSSSNQNMDTSSGSKGIMNTQSDVEGIQDTTKGADSSAETESIQSALSTLQSAMEHETENMYDKTSSLSEKYELKNFVELSMDSNYQYVQLTLKGSILFDSGSADIKEEAFPIFESLGKILESYQGHSIEITGHTDNVPMTSSSYPDNNWLSSARALNAAEYLINNCGIDPDYLKYSGRGEYEPVASNSTAAGRAKNRRIEIKIYNRYYHN
ncbi:MAG: hypothetical protein K0S04_748 [Herbinix sp.]|jgi:chemotaxis protein MotB|nr:hypothetical protein [Herbinix sp.]